MRIRHVRIRNFRGIRELDWTIEPSLACLVGPGDSTKTTILHAIEYALSPRWNISFTDVDFYQAGTENDIQITIAVGDLPKKVLDEFAAGLCLRRWDPTDPLPDVPLEPDDEHLAIIVVQLTVRADLEPEWSVLDIHGNSRKLSARDREALGVQRLGGNTDQDLAWGRGSALYRATTKNGVEEMIAALVSACRDTEGAFCESQLCEVSAVLEHTKVASSRLGVRQLVGLSPGIDTQSLMGRTSALCLKEGSIPLRLAGLGTRRLVTIALQRQSADHGMILLVDEVEHGLEPYRIRHLIRLLQDEVKSQGDTESSVGGSDAGPKASCANQVILSTHSPTAVCELDAGEIYVVRANGGEVVVHPVNESKMQGTVRSVAEAFFSRKVVVCEGATEHGLMIAMRDHWAGKEEHHLLTYEHKGVCVVDGGGCNDAANKALHLAELGYEVAFLRDSDNEPKPTTNELRAKSVSPFQWDKGKAIEDQVVQDLPWDRLRELVKLASDLNGEESALACLCNHLSPEKVISSLDIDTWSENAICEAEARRVIGETAKKPGKERRGWFKSVSKGEELGKLIASALPCMLPEKGLCKTLADVEEWVYED